MLEFRETGEEYAGHPVVLVIDTEEDVEIGDIFWSERNKQFAFEMNVIEVLTSDIKLILAEMERLTAERNKSLFCTFDE